ncbi:MAG: alginate export family protein [Candidatus Omnitrophica bacterium]|nr:alginate export family protein [Candidatus Omnitrophota bacterium]
MGKRLILTLALALVAGLIFSPAYAEVQNVKISGDINVIGVARDHFNLGYGSSTNTTKTNNFFATQTRVRIDADLTDNVSATVRLINERNWTTSSTDSGTSIDLDLAYVTIKEFLYSPLTLTVGRQELRFGNALVIGNINTYDHLNGLPADLTLRKAFDAIRATLNYDPLVIDAFYAKISNDDTYASDDADLYGVNVSYDVTNNINIQPYLFVKTDKSSQSDSSSVVDSEKDSVYTLGGLLTVTPIENLKASLEGAYQFGHNRSDAAGTRDNGGFAIQALADYTFADVKYTPAVGVGYTYLSGNGKKKGWDSMYYDQILNNITYAIFPFTNLSVYNVRASAKPFESVTLSANYGYYRLNKPETSFGFDNYTIDANKKDLGNALDLTATYDYTEDVCFGLTYGLFAKGSAFSDSGDNATQVIGSMTVTF